MTWSFPSRVALSLGALLLVLVGVRGVTVARHQYEAGGERLAKPDTLTATPDAIERGRAVFHGAGTCFVCHGARLEGNVGPTLLAHAWKDAKGGELAAIYAVVTHGVPNTAMVAHPGGISDVQAMQVSAYVWAVSHEKAKP